MQEFRATVSGSFLLCNFYNVDLYQRGYYQIRVSIRTPNRRADGVDLVIRKTGGAGAYLFPPGIVNGQAISQTFEILYHDEMVQLADVVDFKLSVPLTVTKLPPYLEVAMCVELWFADKDSLAKPVGSVQTAFTCLSRRNLTLMVHISEGLHSHRSVMFEYAALAAVSLTVHASITSLTVQPCLSARSPATTKYRRVKTAPGSLLVASSSDDMSKSTSGHNLINTGPNLSPTSMPGVVVDSSGDMLHFLFGASGSNTTQEMRFEAEAMHRAVCCLLLTCYEALQLKITNYLVFLPSNCRIRIRMFNSEDNNHIDCKNKLQVLHNRILQTTCDTDFAAQMTTDVHMLSSELSLLWTQFLELFLGCSKLQVHLLREHHIQRVKRLGEGFFCAENTVYALTAFSNVGSFQLQARIAEALRRSSYFESLPKLPLFCADLDGAPTTVPVIFEDRYFPSTAKDAPAASLLNNAHQHTQSTGSTHFSNDTWCGMQLNLPTLNRLPGTLADSSLLPPSSVAVSQENGILHETQAASEGDRPQPVRRRLRKNIGRKTSRLFRRFRKRASYPQTHTELRQGEQVHGDSGEKQVVSHGSCEPVTLHAVVDKLSSVINVTNRLALSRGANSNYAVQFGSMPNLSNEWPDEVNDPTVAVHCAQLGAGENVARSDSNPCLLNCDACSDVVYEENVSVSFDPPTGSQRCKLPPSEIDDNHERVQQDDSVSDSDDGGDGSSASSGAADDVSRKHANLDDEARAHLVTVQDAVSRQWTELMESATANRMKTERSASVSGEIVTRLGCVLADSLVKFIHAREDFKSYLKTLNFSGTLISEASSQVCDVPYFMPRSPPQVKRRHCRDRHLVICVHGLDGSSLDLRMVKAYLELSLHDNTTEFLMSTSNQDDTFTDFETMTRRLVDEILLFLSRSNNHPSRISFVGHSLGTILIRSALADARLEPWLDCMHTFLSLNGPHCGVIYNTSGLVSVGIWLVQRWKKSTSLQQLALKDNADLRQCFLYELSRKPGLQYFRYVLLVGSYQDHYVPIHSAQIQLCKPALKDTTILGSAYTEMVLNLLYPVIAKGRTTVVRYSAFHALAPNITSSLIGRAAHVAVLDSDLFIEKLVTASALQYFK